MFQLVFEYCYAIVPIWNIKAKNFNIKMIIIQFHISTYCSFMIHKTFGNSVDNLASGFRKCLR